MVFSKPAPKEVVNSKGLGERSEAFIIATLAECGYVVLIPFGSNQAYDLVIEDGDGKFWRIQCKSGWYEHGAIVFATSRSKGHYNKNFHKVGYKGLADYFAVYSRDTNKVYLVPVEEVGEHSAYLRVEQPHRSLLPATRWARDYEL